MIFIGGEENIVKPEEEPMHRLPEGPDDIEQKQKDEAFFCEAGGGIFRVEEGAVKRAPELPEVKSHSERDP